MVLNDIYKIADFGSSKFLNETELATTYIGSPKTMGKIILN